MKWAFAFLFLLFSVATVKAADYEFQFDNFTLSGHLKPIGEIPHIQSVAVFTASTSEDWAGLFAEAGNEMFTHARDTQNKYFWYPLTIVPENYKDDCYWPDGKLVLETNDGKKVEAAEVVAMLQFRPHHENAPMVYLYRQVQTFTFEDIAVQRAKKNCPLLAAFPKTYNPEEVKEILFERRPK